MEQVFTIPYPEFAVAEELSLRYFKKRKGYCIAIPLSRQQKGFDLLVQWKRTKCMASLQVKASAIHLPKGKSKDKFQYCFWFKNFEYHPGASDFYILFGLCPICPNKDYMRRRKPIRWWKSVMLLFSDDDMKDFLQNLKNKSGKKEHSFSIHFNEPPHNLWLVRGAPKPVSLNKFFLSRRSHLIKKFLRG